MTQYDIIYGKKRKGEITSPAKLFFTSCLAVCVATSAMGAGGAGDYKGPYYIGYLCPGGNEPETHNVAHILMDWTNYIDMPSMGFNYAPAYFDIYACSGSAACAYMNVNWLWINQTSSLPVPAIAYTTVPSYMKSNTPYYGPWDDLVNFQSLLDQLRCTEYTCDRNIYEDCEPGVDNCCLFGSGDPGTECCTGNIENSPDCVCNPYINPDCHARSEGEEMGENFGFSAWNSVESCLESSSEVYPGSGNDVENQRMELFSNFIKDNIIDDALNPESNTWDDLWKMSHDKHVCYTPYLDDEAGAEEVFVKYDLEEGEKLTQTFRTPRVSGDDGICKKYSDSCYVEPYRWRCGIFLPYAESGYERPQLLGVIDLQENSEYANIVFIPNSSFDFGPSHTGHYFSDWSTAAPYAYSSWPYNHDSVSPYYNGYHAYGPNSAGYSSEYWEGVLNKTGGHGLTRYSLICVPTRYEFPKIPVYWNGFGNPVPTLYTTYTIQNGEIPDPLDYGFTSVPTPSTGYRFTGWQN